MRTGTDMDRQGEETENWRVNLLIEQGQDFATSTGTLDQEEMSELSDISTKKIADYKITHEQHYDAQRDGETGNILLVFPKSEEHFGKLLSI